MTPRLEHGIAALLVGWFVVAGLSSAVSTSVTVDEFAHLPVGLYAWKTRDFSLYDKSPPLGRMLITAPAWLLGPYVQTTAGGDRADGWRPWRFGAVFLHSNWVAYDRVLLAARCGSLAAGALILVLVWRWSRRRHGPWGGLVSLFAAACSPTLLAHARLVTTDAIAALFLLLFFIAYLAYLERPSLWRAGLLAAGLGLATATKFSAPLFAPFALAAPLIAAFGRSASADGRRPWARAGAHTATIVAALWLSIVAGFFGRDVSFNRSPPLGSKTMRALAPAIRLVPLPQAFVSGLDSQLNDAEGGEFKGFNYLLGERYSGVKPHYYLVAALAKSSPPLLIAFLIGAAMALGRRPRDRGDLVLLLMMGVFFAVASLTSSLQIGVRYLLPIYPPAFMLMGRLGRMAFPSAAAGAPPTAPAGQARLRFLRALLLLGAAWAAIDSVRIWPHYLAYFSPIFGGPANGARVLLDSNLDWGQDLSGIKAWMDQNHVDRLELAYFGHDDPARLGIAYSLPGEPPRAEYTAISANFLMGIKYPLSYNPERIEKDHPIWEIIARYRDRTPVAVIGYSVFIFRTEDFSAGKGEAR